jgi:HK97 family phage major capsid protein
MNSQVLFGVVAGLKQNVGTSAPAVYQPAIGGQPAMWRGFPIEMVARLPGISAPSTPFVCFGNLKYNFIGQRQDITMDSAREATIVQSNADGSTTTLNLWQQGMQALKIEERIDIQVAYGRAFSYAKTAASGGS